MSEPNTEVQAGMSAFLERNGKRPLTLTMLHAVLQPVLGGVGKQLQQLQSENAAMKARVNNLETGHVQLEKTALKGGLPWAKGTTYSAGDVVQHDGSLWRCVE